MKYLKMLGLAAISALAMMAVTAGTASATTLEVDGVTKNSKVEISASLKAGNSLPLTSTSGGTLFNTCTGSTVGGHTGTTVEGHSTGPYTGATVTGPITTLTFTGCNNNVTPHKMGTLHIEHIKGTTNGTLRSSGAEVTSYSAIFGTYLNCKTGEGTHLGTLTGVGTGKHASMHVNAALNCGITSALWSGTYTVTSPTGLGVSA
jgi:hypothetical protein